MEKMPNMEISSQKLNTALKLAQKIIKSLQICSSVTINVSLY